MDGGRKQRRSSYCHRSRLSVLEPTSFPQPTHAADCPGQRAIRVLDQKLEGDHSAHGIAGDVSFKDFQVIKQEYHILDELEAVSVSFSGLPESPCPGRSKALSW
jgi:hypothetical protein